MPGRVRDDELAPRGREVAVRDVDGDALFALGLQAVGQQREIDMPVRGAIDAALLHRGKLVFVHALGVVQQAADQRRLAVVHAAGRGEAQHLLAKMRFEKLLEPSMRRCSGSVQCSAHLEVALPLLHFHRAFFVVIDGAVLALAAAEA